MNIKKYRIIKEQHISHESNEPKKFTYFALQENYGDWLFPFWYTEKVFFSEKDAADYWNKLLELK